MAFENIEKIMMQPIEEAVALPYESYTSDEFFDAEVEKIYRDDWMFACNIAELPNPGDYYAFDIVGEPVVIIHGKDGKLRALSNSCSHRGTQLNDDGFGNGSRMTCPYHAWTFTDQGQLAGVPHPGNVELDKKAHCLPEFKLEIWNGLVFVNLSGNAEPLAERYAGMQKYFDRFGAGNFKDGMANPVYEEWDSNWKLVMENAMESYHLFKVHMPTLETITPTQGAYYLEGCADWTLTAGEKFEQPNTPAQPEEVLDQHYMLVSLPPNFVGIMTTGGLGYLAVYPDAAGRTRVRAGGIFEKFEIPNEHMAEFVAAFFLEDKIICERGQKSMKTRSHKGGKLVELERIMVDFRRFIASRVFGQPRTEVFKDQHADEFYNNTIGHIYTKAS